MWRLYKCLCTRASFCGVWLYKCAKQGKQFSNVIQNEVTYILKEMLIKNNQPKARRLKAYKRQDCIPLSPFLWRPYFSLAYQMTSDVFDHSNPILTPQSQKLKTDHHSDWHPFDLSLSKLWLTPLTFYPLQLATKCFGRLANLNEDYVSGVNPIN